MDDAIHKEKINNKDGVRWSGLGLREIIRLALKEDLEPNGDISSMLLPDRIAKAQIIAKEPGVLACSELIEAILEEYKQNHSLTPTTYHLTPFYSDSQSFQTGDLLFEIEAEAKVLLATERTILNFLQRLCGIATYTNKLVELIKDYPVKLLDTRKTSPGMRNLEKQAFAYGGGTNHRFNLSDMIMLKENHLTCIDDLKTFVQKLKGNKIEVEINKGNLDLLPIVIEAGVDQIMFDNFSPSEIEKIKNSLRPNPQHPLPKLEASGGINESNLVDYAKTGVDYISTSICFTKANNLDLSMLIN